MRWLRKRAPDLSARMATPLTTSSPARLSPAFLLFACLCLPRRTASGSDLRSCDALAGGPNGPAAGFTNQADHSPMQARYVSHSAVSTGCSGVPPTAAGVFQQSGHLPAYPRRGYPEGPPRADVIHGATSTGRRTVIADPGVWSGWFRVSLSTTPTHTALRGWRRGSGLRGRLAWPVLLCADGCPLQPVAKLRGWGGCKCTQQSAEGSDYPLPGCRRLGRLGMRRVCSALSLCTQSRASGWLRLTRYS